MFAADSIAALMKYRVPLLMVFLAFATRSDALTDKGKEAAKRLTSAMTEEAKAQQGTGGGEERKETIRSAMIPRINAVLVNPGSEQNLLETLNQLPGYFTSEAVLAQIAILQSEIRSERETEDKAILDDVQGALAHAGKAVRESQKPADLDGPIAELGKFRQRGDRGQVSEQVRAALYQVEPTLQFVTQWQNYLSAMDTGNAQAAQDALRNLSGANGPSLMPRSEILKLLAHPKPPKSSGNDPEQPSPTEAVEKILADTKSLADMESSLRQLRKLQESRSNSNRMDLINQLIQSILPIDKAYQDYKAGLATNIEISQNFGGGTEIGNAVIPRLKVELMLLMLPRYIGAPEGTRAQPGEDVLSFLNRLATEAKNRGDINVAIRSREALRLLQRGTAFSGSDTAGLSALVSGQNQETAGQYMVAVISYQTSLKSGSDLVPAKLIGERLAAIQSAHPKEFEAGMERFLNPPVSRYEGMPGIQSRPNGMPDPRGGQPAPPALLIPPAPVSSPTAAPGK